MKKLLSKFFGLLGYTISKKGLVSNQFPDLDEKEFWDIYELCKPYTMTSVERMYCLYNSVRYIIENQIEGCFVECGVWRGGSSMLVAKMLFNRNVLDRRLYLYDTFEGMSAPTNNDVQINGESADVLMKRDSDNKEESVWCLADINDVKRNIKLTGFSDERVIYIKGMIEHTIPNELPVEKISLLRLDTDWYESTKHELINFYPLVTLGGVVIIDDYGHWKGCRKAVDEYIQENNVQLLLNRIDYTGRVSVKTHSSNTF